MSGRIASDAIQVADLTLWVTFEWVDGAGSEGRMLATAIYTKMEPAFDQFYFVVDKRGHFVFDLVTARASLSFEHKSEGEMHPDRSISN